MEGFWVAVVVILGFLVLCSVVAGEIIEHEEKDYRRARYLKGLPPHQEVDSDDSVGR